MVSRGLRAPAAPATLAAVADGAIFLEDLQAALHRSWEEGVEPVALLLHPATVIHVSDPALGLDPLGASELDAIDAVPIEIDPLVAVGEVAVRPRPGRPG
jgi:hypothetical protein